MPIMIDIASQHLFLYDEHDRCVRQYPISSGKKGVGEEKGSEKTPRGQHVIHQKFGEGAPIFSIFRARVATGEIWHVDMPAGDFVLSRILWLSGVQTPLDRYIYIHGTHDEKNIGTPLSHGCIRMRNEDMIDLFDRVIIGESVIIKEVL